MRLVGRIICRPGQRHRISEVVELLIFLFVRSCKLSSVGLVIYMLMTPVSISDLEMRRCVLEKAHYELFSHWNEAVY